MLDQLLEYVTVKLEKRAIIDYCEKILGYREVVILTIFYNSKDITDIYNRGGPMSSSK